MDLKERVEYAGTLLAQDLPKPRLPFTDYRIPISAPGVLGLHIVVALLSIVGFVPQVKKPVWTACCFLHHVLVILCYDTGVKGWTFGAVFAIQLVVVVSLVSLAFYITSADDSCLVSLDLILHSSLMGIDPNINYCCPHSITDNHSSPDAGVNLRSIGSRTEP